MTDIILIVIAFLLVFTLFWVGKISYMLQKSLNETIKGMNSLDQRLSRIEEHFLSQDDS